MQIFKDHFERKLVSLTMIGWDYQDVRYILDFDMMNSTKTEVEVRWQRIRWIRGFGSRTSPKCVKD